jgi:ABC-type nitrate/sulfonate/bicarbonate transport system permease component
LCLTTSHASEAVISSSRRELPAWLSGTVSVIAVLGLWQGLAVLTGLPDYVLPAPLDVARALVGDAAVWGRHLGSTLVLAGTGFGISLVLALLIGLAMDQSALVERFARPWLVLSQTVPAFFLYPLLLIALGFGFLPLLVVVVVAGFFPLVVTFHQGLRSTDPALAGLFRSLGASRRATVLRLRIPSALPALFSGLRLVATYDLGTAVMGEYLGAPQGLGVYMARAFKSFAPARVLAAIVVVSLLSLAAYQGVAALERTALKGHRT